jgi:ABC-type amino acid transport system permease subunit
LPIIHGRVYFFGVGMLKAISASRTVIWTDRRYRAILFQALALLGVIVFSAFLIHNALENLSRRGIATGFDFLGSTAGFGIIMHLVDYTEASTYGRAFVVGLLNTLLVHRGYCPFHDPWLRCGLGPIVQQLAGG